MRACQGCLRHARRGSSAEDGPGVTSHVALSGTPKFAGGPNLLRQSVHKAAAMPDLIARATSTIDGDKKPELIALLVASAIALLSALLHANFSNFAVILGGASFGITTCMFRSRGAS